MIVGFIERQLRKVFGATAHDPDPATMSSWERREAQSAMRTSGRGMEAEFVDGSDSARVAAVAASEAGHPEMAAELVDGSEAAARAAEMASETDGSYLHSELAEDTEEAREEVVQSQHHEPPRSELVNDSDAAREAAARANERKDMSAEEKEAQQRG